VALTVRAGWFEVYVAGNGVTARRAMTARATVVAAGLALVGTAQAGAERAAAGHGADTFSGSCKLSGTVAFIPPLTNTPRRLTQHARARGTCSGSFTDRHGRQHQLNNAPVRYRATEYAPSASCDAGIDTGRGKITFRYGSIRFAISETRVGPSAVVTLHGAKGGSAAGHANVSPSANPLTVTEACAGKGLKKAPIDAQAATTPSISG
jgi:hypothetical protein